MTVRGSILSNLQSTLHGVVALKAVEVGKYEPVDLAEIAFPSAYIFQDSDYLDEAVQVTGYQVFNWVVVVEVWCKAADIETLLGAIDAAVAANDTLNGNALYAYRTGSRVYQVDPVRGIAVLQADFKIQYRHPYGSP